MQKLSFSFSGWKKPFVLLSYPQTIRKIKPIILSHLIQELIKILSFSISNEQFNNIEKEILISIHQTLNSELILEKDEESDSFSTRILLLVNSIRFSINNQVIGSEYDDIRFTELPNFDKTSTISKKFQL